MILSSYLVGFMISPATKLLPLIICFVSAFVLLFKLRTPRWQLWVYVGAFALGLILLPFSAMAWAHAQKTYGAEGTLWLSSVLSFMSMNIGPLVLLAIALKANAYQAAGKEH